MWSSWQSDRMAGTSSYRTYSRNWRNNHSRWRTLPSPVRSARPFALSQE